jgi:hypothetical protein
MNRIFITLLTLSLGLPALGQDSPQADVPDDAQGRARLVARGDLVEITGGVSERQSVSEPLKEGDSLRTGPASFAVIDVDPGIRLTMGPGAAIELESLDALPSIRLEQGRVRVQTDSWALRVRTSAGDFLVSEAPGEAELELSEGKVFLQVLSGGLTMENVSTEAVVFRAPGQGGARIHQVGSTSRPQGAQETPYPETWFPNVYVGYPGIPYEIPSNAPPPGNRPGPDRRR